MEFLRHYHSEMGKLIFKYEGTLERFYGRWDCDNFQRPDFLAKEAYPQSRAHGDLKMRDRVKDLRQEW